MSDQDLLVKLNQLEARKQALKAEIDGLEQSVQTSFEGMREDIEGLTSPTWWIRSYPLHAVGLALAFGFFAAKGGRGRGSATFAANILSELKAVAARKAVNALVQTIDKKG
jgi:hypothetical protein